MTNNPFTADTPITVAALDAYFGNEDNYGIIAPSDELEGHTFPDGTSWARCTNWANQVATVLPCSIFGFHESDNPTSEIAQVAGGHDFALFADRYIIDGWVKNVECMSERGVFDLEDPNDLPVIQRLYGSRQCWESADEQKECNAPS